MSAATATATRTVEAAPDDLFRLITDVARLPEWNSAIRAVVDQPAGLEPGSEWVVELHALGQSWHSRSRVEEVDATRRRFAYRSCTDDGNPSWARWVWEVAADPAGSRVTVTWELHPVTFWRRVLLARIRARQLARSELPGSLAALSAAVRPSGAR